MRSILKSSPLLWIFTTEENFLFKAFNSFPEKAAIDQEVICESNI